MATFLDIGILKALGNIFPMLLVFVVVYGILTYTNTFKDNKGVQAMIAFVLAMMTLFVPNLVDVIKIMSPWFTILMIFLIFMLLLYKIFGATDADIKGVLSDKYPIVIWIIVISVIILLGSLGKVYFSEPGSAETSTKIQNGTIVQTGDTGTVGQSAFWATMFHPKILGMIFILLIAMFAAITITVEKK